MADEEQFVPLDGVADHIAKPISPEEIRETLRTSRSNAAGPDGLRIAQLRKVSLHRLVLAYNAMWSFGATPRGLKINRTVLLPKEGDPKVVDNWRPITIASVHLRVLHKIIGQRLSTLPLHEHQRGFRRTDGVLINNITLQALIKNRRLNKRPYSLLSLDLRKAFDTVSQKSVLRVLARFNVGARVTDYISDNYLDSITKVQVGSASTEGITMARGVKQGDPMSPYLFNMVLDELLREVESVGKGCPSTTPSRCRS